MKFGKNIVGAVWTLDSGLFVNLGKQNSSESFGLFNLLILMKITDH